MYFLNVTFLGDLHPGCEEYWAGAWLYTRVEADHWHQSGSGTLLAEKIRMMTRKQLFIMSHLFIFTTTAYIIRNKFTLSFVKHKYNLSFKLPLNTKSLFIIFAQRFTKIRLFGCLSTLQKSRWFQVQEINTSSGILNRSLMWYYINRKNFLQNMKHGNVFPILSQGSFVLIFLDIQCSFLYVMVNCQAWGQLSSPQKSKNFFPSIFLYVCLKAHDYP